MDKISTRRTAYVKPPKSAPSKVTLNFAHWNIDGFNEQSVWAIERAIDEMVNLEI